MANYKNISYFEGLSGLRFIAAFLVVMHHTETIRRKNDLPNLEWFSLFRNGTHAVVFFFVLSGFLITYLLLKENYRTKTVSIRNFYARRILRIWPLYFLVVLLGTVAIPAFLQIINYDYPIPYTHKETWYYFLFFLPGLVTFYYGSSILEPLWSIGVEEVFYLLWAPVFKWLKKNLLAVICFIIALKYTLLFIDYYYPSGSDVYRYLLHMFRFESMSIGAFGAWFIYNRAKDINQLKVYRKPVQIALYGILIFFLMFYKNIPLQNWEKIYNHPFVSFGLNLLFIYLIMGVSMIEHNIIKLKGKPLEYLGDISYGIYMYHLFIIFAIILFLKNMLAGMSLLWGSLLFYTLAAAGVILVAHLSKKYFENYFLRMKHKYSK